MCVLTCSTQTNHRCGPNEVNRLAIEFGFFASLFNGTRIENEDGTTTILQAEPSNNWFLWKAGLVDGSPYEEERKHEAESRKLMSADISDGHALVHELEETTDYIYGHALVHELEETMHWYMNLRRRRQSSEKIWNSRKETREILPRQA